MAKEALVSLNLMIQRFVNIGYSYTHSDTILVSSFYSRNRNRWNNILLPILHSAESVQEELWSLKSILESHHFKETEELNAFKGEILEAIPQFRGVLEDLLNKSQLLFSDTQSLDGESRDELEIISQDLEKGRKEMFSFCIMMEKIIKEYNAKLDQETSNMESPLVDEDFGENTKDMVEVYDEDIRRLIHKLLKERPYTWRTTIAVVGMGGIGKTTIVKAVYNNPVISDYFDTRAFIKVGPDYHLKDILLDLLVCLSPNYNKILEIKKSEDELGEQIYEFMKSKTYLIVLDDVWDTDLWGDMKRCIPNGNKGSKIIFTTRLFSVASNFSIFYDVLKISFRNEEQSWNLFCRKVFVEDSCPPGLEKIGKKIVKKCGGLPLGIISVANILFKAEKMLDYWEKVSKNENLLALATEEWSHMSESLFLSYKNLPPHLKECCLYIGVFPLNHEINVSKLVKLWVGEGLVQPRRLKTFEDTGGGCIWRVSFHIILF